MHFVYRSRRLLIKPHLGHCLEAPLTVRAGSTFLVGFTAVVGVAGLVALCSESKRLHHSRLVELAILGDRDRKRECWIPGLHAFGVDNFSETRQQCMRLGFEDAFDLFKSKLLNKFAHIDDRVLLQCCISSDAYDTQHSILEELHLLLSPVRAGVK